MIQLASIETEKAERYMKALCNHFARKITARYEGDQGWIEFGDGTCHLAATATALTFQAEAQTDEGMAHVKRAVETHLARFAPDDSFQFTWTAPAEPGVR